MKVHYTVIHDASYAGHIRSCEHVVEEDLRKTSLLDKRSVRGEIQDNGEQAESKTHQNSIGRVLERPRAVKRPMTSLSCNLLVPILRSLAHTVEAIGVGRPCVEHRLHHLSQQWES